MPTEIEIIDDQNSVYHYGRYSNPDLDKYVDQAIDRMKSQPEPLKAAAVLLQRWFEAGTLPAEVLPDLIFDYLSARVAARAATNSQEQE